MSEPTWVRERINALLARRGKTPDWHPLDGNVELGSKLKKGFVETDPKAYQVFITKWDEAALGPRPTVADGFKEVELSMPAD